MISDVRVKAQHTSEDTVDMLINYLMSQSLICIIGSFPLSVALKVNLAVSAALFRVN